MTKQGEMARLARQIVDSYCIAMPVTSSRILLRMVQVLADRVGVLEADLGECLAWATLPIEEDPTEEEKHATSVSLLPSEQRPADTRPAEAEH